MLIQLAQPAVAERNFYRYSNSAGNTVINHTLPPEYAQKGYEVISASGQVIRVVEPALDELETSRAEAERLEAERLARWDERLLRRYSSVMDINAAKERKLAELQGNIAIQQGNLRNLRTQLANLQAEAADQERAGKAIPKTLLDNMVIVNGEIAITEEQIASRQEEYDEIARRYDEDADRFRIIRPDSQTPVR